VASPLRIALELDRGDPVTGRARDADGREQRFVGWLELHAAIDRLRWPAEPSKARPDEARKDGR